MDKTDSTTKTNSKTIWNYIYPQEWAVNVIVLALIGKGWWYLYSNYITNPVNKAFFTAICLLIGIIWFLFLPTQGQNRKCREEDLERNLARTPYCWQPDLNKNKMENHQETVYVYNPQASDGIKEEPLTKVILDNGIPFAGKGDYNQWAIGRFHKGQWRLNSTHDCLSGVAWRLRNLGIKNIKS